MTVDVSDMAEAAAIVGLVASIGSLIDLSAKVVSRLHDFTSKTSDIPDSFRSLSIRLPLLSVTLQHIRNQAKAGHLPNDVATALKAVVDGISTQVSFLETCLFSIIPPDGAPKLIQVLKAWKSLVEEDKVRQALEQIHKSIEVLVLHQTTRLIDLGDRILEGLSQLNVVLPASSKSCGVMSKDLSQRSDEMIRRTSDFQADLFQVIAELQLEQMKLRLTILDSHSGLTTSTCEQQLSALDSPSRDLLAIQRGALKWPLTDAAEQSGSGRKLLGEDASYSKSDNLSESDRALHATALRKQNSGTLTVFCPLTKFRCLPTLAQMIRELIAYIWLLYPYSLQFLTFLRSTIPRAPRLFIADSIIFEDVLGRISKLQYVYFKCWNVFEAFLKSNFRGFPGEGKVISGDYYLLDSNIRGLIINKAHWERLVFPGRRVSMSVLLEAVSRNERTCPRPGCVGKSANAADQQTMLCSTCGLRCFLIHEDIPLSSTSTVEALPEDQPQENGCSGCVEPATEITAPRSPASSSRAVLNDFELSELLQFRSVHIKSTILARGATFISRSSYGIQRNELFNTDLEGHLSSHPKVDRIDGLRYVCNTIDWVIQKGDEIPAQFEKHLRSLHTFPLSRKRWLCQETVFVSDHWQRSHYEMNHPMNKDARIAGSIILDLDNDVRDRTTVPLVCRNRLKTYYEIHLQLVIMVKGGGLTFEAQIPRTNGRGKKVEALNRSIRFERAF